jgi:hypothetical protein
VPKMIGLFLAIMLGVLFLVPCFVFAAGERGQAPQCQEHCLANHITMMQRLSEELAKTSDILTYQDQVEREISSYSACLTNCRLVLPVK